MRTEIIIEPLSMFCEEMTKVRLLCTKFEKIFLRNLNNMAFCDRVYHKIKIKKGAVPFRRTYGSMGFKKERL